MTRHQDHIQYKVGSSSHIATFCGHAQLILQQNTSHTIPLKSPVSALESDRVFVTL